jgi:hypothetical protein
MDLKRYLRQFGWHWGIVVVGLLLVFSGVIFALWEPAQYVIKKVFILSLWYVFVYLVRYIRIGEINWDDEWAKRIYYFVLLLGSALILSFS